MDFESLDEFKSFTVENNLISSKDVLNINCSGRHSSQQHKWDLYSYFISMNSQINGTLIVYLLFKNKITESLTKHL